MVYFNLKITNRTTQEVIFKITRAGTLVQIQKDIDAIIIDNSYEGVTSLNYVEFSKKFKLQIYNVSYTWAEAKSTLMFKEKYINIINRITNGYVIEKIELEKFAINDIKKRCRHT